MSETDQGSPAYLAGLLLSGRKVVVVGGGRVAVRRIPRLVRAGARVDVIAPELDPRLADLMVAAAITWRAWDYAPSDLDEAWYVLAATDSPEVNAAVAADAEARRIFCVRADLASAGSAWTPAAGDVAGATVAAITGRDPHRARRMRDRLVQVVRDEDL